MKRGLDLLAEHPAMAMLIGAGIAVAWGVTGSLLGRGHRRREDQPGADSEADPTEARGR